jgi:NTE family protein
MPLDQIEEVGLKLKWRDVGRMTMSRLGFQSNARLEDYLRSLLPVVRFEDLQIPFAVVATDLHSGQPVIMRDHGDVPSPFVRAARFPACTFR